MAKKTSQPWMYAEYELADAAAIKAVAAGTASADQQRRAIDWIITKACSTYDMSYRPGADEGRRDTDFAEGKRHVGNQIVKLIKADLSSMRRKEPNADPHEPKS